eukprot:Sspe_Gene.99268::Locus_72712_Transcript_1_1_Confidence_1.000_Length_1138::g.99268::m.99268
MNSAVKSSPPSASTPLGIEERGYEGINIDEDLLCAVCHSLLESPVQTSCDHHFCRSCFNTALKSNNVCPFCREPNPCCTDSSRLVKGLLARQRIKCTRCGTEMQRDQWETHEQTCDFTPLTCPHSQYGCKARPMRRKLSTHASTCEFRPQRLRSAVLNMKVDVERANKSEEVVDVPLCHDGALSARNALTFRLEGDDIIVLRPGVVSISVSVVARARQGWTEAHERYHGLGIQINGILVAYSLFPRRVQRSDCVSATLTHHSEVNPTDIITFRIGMASKRLVDDLQAKDISIRWDSLE